MTARTTGNRWVALGALGIAAVALAGCDLLESVDTAAPSPSESATVEQPDQASPEPAETADDGDSGANADGGSDSDPGTDSDAEMLASGSARIVLNDMDVYTTSELNCTVSGEGMAFDAELDGPHRGQTFLDGSFGVDGEPDSVGMMMDSGQASFPFWVVQEEHSAERAIGEFDSVEWEPGDSYVAGSAVFEAVAEHNVTLTDPPTYQPGTFEIRC